MLIIESNSAFNIDGDNPEKGKSTIDFSALHIFDVLETSHIENENLLSSFQHQNQFIIDEGLNSFLITDDLFKKTMPKPEAPKAENKNEENGLKMPVSLPKIPEKEVPKEDFFTPITIEKIEKVPVENENIIPEISENLTVDEGEETFAQAIFIAETENILSIDNALIVPENQVLEAENEIDLLHNNSEKMEKDINISKEGVILHKKQNLLVKIIVKEGDLAQYFESKDNTLFTETDNMSPETTSIIDRFLEKEPKLSRSRMNLGEKDAPIKNLLQRDEDEIVTETMAYIYAIQGNKTEALRIYEKLSLQFPEKSTYFATRIKAVMKD